MSINPRKAAARILSRILQGRGSLSTLPPEAPGAGDALARELCYGVCRHYHELQHVLSGLLERPLRNKDGELHALLLCGLYQLFYLRVPDHAAIHETVSAAGLPWARGLVNAVLREARRRYPSYDAGQNPDIAVRHSHPAWLADQLRRDWPEDYLTILRGNNIRAPMTLRVNLQRGSREHYLQELQQAGVQAEPSSLVETGVILEQPLEPAALPGFAEGRVSVQDEASQLAAPLLRVGPGMRVLDACAAPGGKTCALLEAEPSLDVLALDNDPDRLAKVRDNLDRQGLAARLVPADALEPALWWDGTPFDRILLDAPCSATGVIRRHPDIKLLRRGADIPGLVEKQRALLAAAWRTLKPKGLLLYSTCSILIKENNCQIGHFVENTPGARCLDIPADWGHALTHGRQLLPGEGTYDGFYYALLQKC